MPRSSAGDEQFPQLKLFDCDPADTPTMLDHAYRNLDTLAHETKADGVPHEFEEMIDVQFLGDRGEHRVLFERREPGVIRIDAENTWGKLMAYGLYHHEIPSRLQAARFVLMAVMIEEAVTMVERGDAIVDIIRA